MEIYHILNIRHCKNCPLVNGGRDRQHCGLTGSELYSLNQNGVTEWKSWFPYNCPLLSCNYKKPKDFLIMERVGNSFHLSET